MDFEYVKQRFNALDEKLQGLIELNNRLVLENIKLHNQIQQPARSAVIDEVPAPNVKRDEPAKPKILEILSHTIRSNDGANEVSIKVIGNTYLHRSLLKENGGSWDKNISAWVFSDTCLENLVNALTEKEVEFKNHVPLKVASVLSTVRTDSTRREDVSQMEFMEE
jgi:hypothetical protein